MSSLPQPFQRFKRPPPRETKIPSVRCRVKPEFYSWAMRTGPSGRNKIFPNRSQAIETALTDKLDRLDRVRLAQECSKLDPAREKELAEEGFSEELSRWPQY